MTSVTPFGFGLDIHLDVFISTRAVEPLDGGPDLCEVKRSAGLELHQPLRSAYSRG